MSPYLFVIAMEYPHKILNQLARNKAFKFYRKCKKLDTVHACFVDDLLMFCGADLASIGLLNQAFMKVSQDWLQVNTCKSSLYLAGICAQLK